MDLVVESKRSFPDPALCGMQQMIPGIYAKKAASEIHKRTFVVMTAQLKTFGWSFAKELDFYHCLFV